MITRNFVHLVLFTLIAYSTQAGERIDIASDSWQNFVDEEGNGYYLDLLRHIYPSPKYDLSLTIVPYSRSLYMAKTNKTDIVLGIWANEYKPSLLSKYPVEVDLYDVIIRKGYPDFTGPKSFNGLRVLAKVGYGIDEILDKPASYEEKTDLGIMIRMIEHDRADVLFDYSAELNEVIATQGLDSSLEVKSNALAEHAYFGFCSTARCAQLKQIFDTTYLKMHKSGIVEKLLIKNHQPAKALPELIKLDDIQAEN